MPLQKYDVTTTGWPKAVTDTITAGQSLSSGIDLGSGFPARIVLPANWVTALLTFQTGDGTTWQDHYDEDGTEITVPVGAGVASRSIRLAPAKWVGIRHLRIRSGSGASPVTQTTTDKIISIIVLPRGVD